MEGPLAKVKNEPHLAATTEVPQRPSYVGSFEYTWDTIINGLIILGVILVAVFMKGRSSGIKKAPRDFQNKPSELTEEYQKTLSSLALAHGDLQDQLKLCKLVPEHHVLLPLDEGSSRHKMPSGYVLRIDIAYEHRVVAEEALARKLAPNEVVHHIYGPRREDNRPENLCVLDRDYHDLWHTFMDRELRMKGRYPPSAEQKWLLKTYYGGILVEEALAQKDSVFPPAPKMSRAGSFQIPDVSIKNNGITSEQKQEV